MRNNLILTALIGDNITPDIIECRDSQKNIICNILHSDNIEFVSKFPLTLNEVKQITQIAENFNLFFANITKG